MAIVDAGTSIRPPNKLSLLLKNIRNKTKSDELGSKGDMIGTDRCKDQSNGRFQHTNFKIL